MYGACQFGGREEEEEETFAHDVYRSNIGVQCVHARQERGTFGENTGMFQCSHCKGSHIFRVGWISQPQSGRTRDATRIGM